MKKEANNDNKKDSIVVNAHFDFFMSEHLSVNVTEMNSSITIRRSQIHQ